MSLLGRTAKASKEASRPSHLVDHSLNVGSWQGLAFRRDKHGRYEAPFFIFSCQCRKNSARRYFGPRVPKRTVEKRMVPGGVLMDCLYPTEGAVTFDPLQNGRRR